MFVLNYKKQFAPAVRSGEKRQTIRAQRKDGRLPKVGETLRHYTGMRTSTSEHLSDSVCKVVVPIHISAYAIGNYAFAIVVGKRHLTFEEGTKLAKADGFGSRAEFIDFFKEAHGFPFDGFLVKW